MSKEYDHRREIIANCLKMNSSGLNQGTSGNLSVRWGDGMLVTPSGIAYETLQPEDMVPVQFTGPGTATWQHPLDPSSEWAMHQAVYQARPEAGARMASAFTSVRSSGLPRAATAALSRW